MGAIYAVHITLSRTSAHAYQADRWQTPYFSILKGRHNTIAEANADARQIALFGSEEHHFDLSWKEINDGEAELIERKITDRAWLKERYDAERVEMRGELGWRKITIVYPGGEVQGLCQSPTTYKKLCIFVEQESSDSGPRQFNDRHRESSEEYIQHQERPPPGGRRFNRRERTREPRPPRTFKRERRESMSPGPGFPRRVRRRYSTNFQPYQGDKREYNSSRILPKVVIPPRGSSPYHSTSPPRQQTPVSSSYQQQHLSKDPEAQHRNPPIYNPTLQFSKQLLQSEDMGYSAPTAQQGPSRASTVETVIINDQASQETQAVGTRTRSNSTNSTAYSPSPRNPPAPTTPIRENPPVSPVPDIKAQAVSSDIPLPTPLAEVNATAPSNSDPKQSELDELRRTILSITNRFETFVSQTQPIPATSTEKAPLDIELERTTLANERKALEALQTTLAAERSQIELDRLNITRETALLNNLEASLSEREGKLAQAQGKLNTSRSTFDNGSIIQIRQREQNLLALESTLKTKEANIEDIRLALTRSQMNLKNTERKMKERGANFDRLYRELQEREEKLARESKIFDDERRKFSEVKAPREAEWHALEQKEIALAEGAKELEEEKKRLKEVIDEESARLARDREVMEKEVGEERVQVDLAKLEFEQEKTKLDEEKSVVKNKAKKLEGMFEVWIRELKECYTYTDEGNAA